MLAGGPAGFHFARSWVCCAGCVLRDFANLAFVDRAIHPLTLTRAGEELGLSNLEQGLCVAFARSNRSKRQHASKNNLEIFHDGILTTARRNELRLCALLPKIPGAVRNGVEAVSRRLELGQTTSTTARVHGYHHSSLSRALAHESRGTKLRCDGAMSQN